MRTIECTNRFKRDYKHEKRGQLGAKLDELRYPPLSRQLEQDLGARPGGAIVMAAGAHHQLEALQLGQGDYQSSATVDRYDLW